MAFKWCPSMDFQFNSKLWCKVSQWIPLTLFIQINSKQIQCLLDQNHSIKARAQIFSPNRKLTKNIKQKDADTSMLISLASSVWNVTLLTEMKNLENQMILSIRMYWTLPRKIRIKIILSNLLTITEETLEEEEEILEEIFKIIWLKQEVIMIINLKAEIIKTRMNFK